MTNRNKNLKKNEISCTMTKENGNWEWYSITCPCGNPYAYRPMIQCDDCDQWFHLTCENISTKQIPAIFICQTCTLHVHSMHDSNILTANKSTKTKKQPFKAHNVNVLHKGHVL